jgi:hypothetical protein
MFNHTTEVAKACIAICERNGHWESARLIGEKYFIKPPQSLGVLLTPQGKHEDRSN